MALPAQLRAIQHHLRTAQEHEKRDPVVTYYCRLYAMQTGMKLDSKTPECRKFLVKLMDQLETMKKELIENDSITQEVVGNAHIENYALKLFLYADNEDRAERFHKNMIKSFYTSSLLMDVLSVFGELSDEVGEMRQQQKTKQPASFHSALSYQKNFPPFSGKAIPAARSVPAVDLSLLNAKQQGGVQLSPEDFTKAQKYCKYAGSALQYEDIGTAIQNLQKALKLLTTGKE
uniref:Vesicle (multivesicular body) trafficking 1 n=1 Tax=Xiphophorus couchianus TaxID=32473 RepID=A0A3B5MPE0_9TELE